MQLFRQLFAVFVATFLALRLSAYVNRRKMRSAVDELVHRFEDEVREVLVSIPDELEADV